MRLGLVVLFGLFLFAPTGRAEDKVFGVDVKELVKRVERISVLTTKLQKEFEGMGKQIVTEFDGSSLVAFPRAKGIKEREVVSQLNVLYQQLSQESELIKRALNSVPKEKLKYLPAAVKKLAEGKIDLANIPGLEGKRILALNAQDPKQLEFAKMLAKAAGKTKFDVMVFNYRDKGDFMEFKAKLPKLNVKAGNINTIKSFDLRVSPTLIKMDYEGTMLIEGMPL